MISFCESLKLDIHLTGPFSYCRQSKYSNSQKIYWSCPNIKIYYKVCELLNNQQKEKHIWNVGLYQGTFLSFLYHSGWKNTRFATRLHSSTESKQKTVIIALNYIPSVMLEEPFWSGHSVFASVLTHFIKIMNFYSLIIRQNKLYVVILKSGTRLEFLYLLYLSHERLGFPLINSNLALTFKYDFFL